MSINPTTRYTFTKLFVVPYISSTPWNMLPTVSVAIPQLYNLTSDSPGIEFVANLLIVKNTSVPPKNGIKKANIIKAEYTSCEKYSYIAAKTMQKAEIPKYIFEILSNFSSDFLVSDVNNVAHTPFPYIIPVCCRIIYYITVEIHCR